MKALLLLQVLEEIQNPYPYLSVRLVQLFQQHYRNDPSVKLDIIEVPTKYHKRFSHLWNILSFTLKSFPLLSTITKYDVILSSQGIPNIVLSIIITFMRKLLRKKISLVILDTSAARILASWGRIKLGLFRFLLLPVDKFISFNQSEYLFWTKHLGFSNRACYIPFGIDIDFLEPTAERDDYIFSVGGEGRDFATLILAMEQVDARLLLIARPEPGRQLFNVARLPENVELIPPVSDEEYRDLLSHCSFVVMPLQGVPGGQGTTAIGEAMAAGKAVIGTKTGGALEYLTDGETGLLVEPGNVDDLRQKIVFLLNHPEEAERMGENARREAEAKPSRYAAIEAVKNILEEVHLQRTKGKAKYSGD